MAERPPRTDARRNREKVLRAARDAFAASGYSVPLDEIAARAGVGPGTVYRHFPSKEELFEAVVTARVRDLIDDARGRSGDADPGQAFFGFLGRIRQEAAAKRDLPEAIAIAGPLQDDLHAALDTLLRRAQQAARSAPRSPLRTSSSCSRDCSVASTTHPPAQRARPWLTGCSPSWLTDYGHIPDPTPSLRCQPAHCTQNLPSRVPPPAVRGAEQPRR